jgi:hypothetical protein
LSPYRKPRTKKAATAEPKPRRKKATSTQTELFVQVES